MTDAEKDQEHISTVVLNHATIPDRTAYILDKSQPNPLPVMINDAKRLESAGADFIVIPCNTAHYFYEEIQANVGIPILNIIEETVKYAKQNNNGIKKLGILATDGTIQAGSYQRVCEKYGIECLIPDKDDRTKLMHIIYGCVKAGKKADFDEFFGIIENMKNRGCDAVVLGCTELSVVHRDYKVNRNDVIDSLEVLAKTGILRCGKKLKENT